MVVLNRVAGSGERYWETKPLTKMSKAEWEALCDGCGRCCLNKLEDWHSGEIYWTNLACNLLDCTTCRCTDYANRFAMVPDCLELTPENLDSFTWLPPTCAYARLRDGKPLADWHPLISGSHHSVYEAGISVRGRADPEGNTLVEEYEDHLVEWPGKEK